MPNNDCLKKNSAAESAKLLECACPFWRFWTLNLNLDLNRNPRGSVLPSTLIILAKDAETRFRTLVVGQSKLSRIMRYYCSGVLTGTAIGINLGALLERKMGWPPGDPRSYLLCMLLLFAGIVVGELERRKRKR